MKEYFEWACAGFAIPIVGALIGIAIFSILNRLSKIIPPFDCPDTFSKKEDL